MSLRSTLTRLGIAGAAATLALSAAALPAAADDGDGDWDGGSRGDWGNNEHFDPNDGPQHHHDHDSGRDDPRRYRGVVTADELLLRSAPDRGSRVIRVAYRGEVVSIYCKTPGQSIQGNPLWYLLTDGTWAWGAARYIDNIGPAPRWC